MGKRKKEEKISEKGKVPDVEGDGAQSTEAEEEG